MADRKTNMNEKYTVVSLFSGGMGLDLGLEYTGRFELLACVEKDRACCDTIRQNKKAGRLGSNLQLFEEDISKISPEEVLGTIGLKVGELDLLVGGPPCQSFSTAGKRKTVQDPRGTLLWQFLHYVKIMQPKCFLMENVRGLLSSALKHRPIAERPDKGGTPLDPDEEPGSVIKLFAKDLEKICSAPYHMDCFEVNSVNYGAPQIRERALLIGNRYNAVVDFPNPTHGPTTRNSDSNHQFSLLDTEHQPKIPWKTLRDAIGNLKEDNPVVLDFSPRKKKYLNMVPEGSNWRSLPVKVQQESMGKAWHAKGGRSGWWRRLTFDLPCPTLVTMPNHASTSLCHPIETRALSIREYALIQEFPDNWEFSGTISEQYSQVGNAVPTRLGTVAGMVVVDLLDQLSKRNWEKYRASPKAYRLVYVQSHIRTRQWFKNGKAYVWQDGDENLNAAYAKPKTVRKESVIS